MTNDKSVDVAVIGAGVVGVQVARALQRDGKTVIIIDEKAPAQVCSFGNAGYIAVEEVVSLANISNLLASPKMLMNAMGPLAIRWRDLPSLTPWFLRFAKASLNFKANSKGLAELSSRAHDAWQRVTDDCKLHDIQQQRGHLRLCETEKAWKKSKHHRELYSEFGVKFHEVSAGEAADIAPGLTSKVHKGVFFSEGSQLLDPELVVNRIAETFQGAGGQIVRAKVQGLTCNADGHYDIQTPLGDIPAKSVVVAAGQGSHHLLSPLGVSVPMVAERGYHMMMEGGAASFDLPVAFDERGFIMTPMSMGLRLAGTIEFALQNTPETWQRADLMETHLRDLFPDFGGKATTKWMGERPTLPDYLPAIGPIDGHPNLYAAYGHQHMGVTLSAVTADILVEQMNGRATGLDMCPYDPNRFS